MGPRQRERNAEEAWHNQRLCSDVNLPPSRERERVPYSAAPPSRKSIDSRLSVSRELYNFNLASACRVEHFDEGWTNVREEWKDEVSTYGRICNDLYFAILNS